MLRARNALLEAAGNDLKDEKYALKRELLQAKAVCRNFIACFNITTENMMQSGMSQSEIDWLNAPQA